MDLSTTYMGLRLSSPLVPSASPLSESIDGIKRMEDCGAGAIVLGSLFEEQIAHDAQELEYYLKQGADRFGESLTYFPDLGEYRLGSEGYLEHLRKASQAVDIPIIASLNGVSSGGWTRYAEDIQQAGADAIELNIYYIPTDPQLTSGQVEQVYLDALKAVKQRVSITVAVKISPIFSSMVNMLTRLDQAGADGLVLFNRFDQPDFNLTTMEVSPDLVLSQPAENRLPLRWIATVFGKVAASLAATTGIHTGRDAAKMILAGADVAMLCSALLRDGIERLAEIRTELIHLADSLGYDSISQMKGVLSQQHCPEPDAFERANYMKVLHSFGKTPTLE